MKRWLAMSGVRIAKLASSFSLVLLVACALADTYRDLDRSLRNARTVEDVRIAVRGYRQVVAQDPVLDETFEGLDGNASIEKFKSMVRVRAAAEAPLFERAAEDAKAIKANPLYRDPGVQEQSNWLDGAIKRLVDLFPKNAPKSNVRLPSTTLPGWVVPFMWFVLAAIVAAFGYFVFRHFSWKRALRRKAIAMLDEDEPDRTLDEWLSIADQHLADGRFREAVRAMYLSCLLKFDEAGVARFIRGETNWEHFARISKSPKLPSELDFRPPTQAFDRIWYGFHVDGRTDVEQFRAWYQAITESLRKVGK